jgi:hypothetical protein
MWVGSCYWSIKQQQKDFGCDPTHITIFTELNLSPTTLKKLTYFLVYFSRKHSVLLLKMHHTLAISFTCDANLSSFFQHYTLLLMLLPDSFTSITTFPSYLSYQLWLLPALFTSWLTPCYYLTLLPVLPPYLTYHLTHSMLLPNSLTSITPLPHLPSDSLHATAWLSTSTIP